MTFFDTCRDRYREQARSHTDLGVLDFLRLSPKPNVEASLLAIGSVHAPEAFDAANASKAALRPSVGSLPSFSTAE